MKAARIATILSVVRGSIGLTMGLYLYAHGLVIYEAMRAAGAGGTAVAFGIALAPLQWAAGLEAVISLGKLCFEMPTGVLADLVGRKTLTVASLFFRSFFFFFLAGLALIAGRGVVAPWLVVVIVVVAHLCFSLHYTMLSGAFVAWAQDAFDEAGAPERFTPAFVAAQSWYWGLFALGSMLGIVAMLLGWNGGSFLLGGLLSLGVAVWCLTAMAENRGYAFVPWREAVGGARREIAARAWSLFADGGRTALRTPRLMLVFAMSAAVMSMINLVDFVWPVFVSERFPGLFGTFSTQWIVLVLAFCLSSFAGNYWLVGWVSRASGGASTSPATMARLTAAGNLLLVAPLVALAVVMRSTSGDVALWAFIGLMTFQRLVDGCVFTLTECLQNLYIPLGRQERSTVLSFGAMPRNVMATMLIFFGAGASAGSMETWLIPGAAVVLISMLVLWVERPRAAEKKVSVTFQS